MHVGCAETKPSVRCLRKRQRFAIRLRHGLRFLNWITNGSYRVTISSVTIARRNSEQRRREKRHSIFALPEMARPVYRRVFLTAGVWSMRSIAINDLAAEAPPVLPVLPARRWIMAFPLKNPASLPVYSRLVLRMAAPRCCRLIHRYSGSYLSISSPRCDQYPISLFKLFHELIRERLF